MNPKPELLAPAGNLEKLKVAVLYGADAVYLSGQQYGLRASSDNFSEAELQLAVSFARKHGSKTYITLNGFLHDEDLEQLGDFCRFLESIEIDAVIVSDLGVAQIVKEHSSLTFFLSTQASCLNSSAAKVWKELGAKRIIVGRELSIAEASRIGREANIEIEMFVHGAMCMAYSGVCNVSNYTAARDANRGGCIQSCRFAWEQQELEGEPSITRHFLSSKDLKGLAYLNQYIEHKITSLKIEGRMKSLLYVATLCKAYRRAIDAYCEGTWSEELEKELEAELNSMPHREYTEASLIEAADTDSVYLSNKSPASNASHKMLGIVLELNDEHLLVSLYQPLTKGDEIEFLPFKEAPIVYEVKELKNAIGEEVDKARQATVVVLPRVAGVEVFNVVRAKQES